MKIIWLRDKHGYKNAPWFMRTPVDGPAWVAVSRVQEANERVIGGEKGWKRSFNKACYLSMLDNGVDE